MDNEERLGLYERDGEDRFNNFDGGNHLRIEDEEYYEDEYEDEDKHDDKRRSAHSCRVQCQWSRR